MSARRLPPPYLPSGGRAPHPALALSRALARARALRTETIELLQTLMALYPARDAGPMTERDERGLSEHSLSEHSLDEHSLAAAGLVLDASLDGHTCLDRDALTLRLREARDTLLSADPLDGGGALALSLPPGADALIDALAAAPITTSWEPGHAETPSLSPIVYAHGSFYTHRYALIEARIVAALRARSVSTRTNFHAPDASADDIQRILKTFIDALPRMEDEQRRAVERALLSGFTLLTGGPGTGKTWTVRNILAVEIAAALRQGLPVPRIALAAPTGKAAARMVESLSAGLDTFIDDHGLALVGGDADARDALHHALAHPNARTLHRLLGLGGPTVGRRRDRIVHADIVVVDEVSMVDATMMATLLDALNPDTALILIGDPHQLASVDAGSVLADLVELAHRVPKLGERLVQLTTSRRFTAESPVGQMASAALRGDAHAAIWNAHLQPVPDDEALPAALVHRLAEGFRALTQASGAEDPPDGLPADLWDTRAREAIAALGRFQVLSSHRAGGRSVASINDAVQRALFQRGWMRRPKTPGLAVGTPVLVLKNDYALNRYNGDIGVVIVPGYVSFLNPDGAVQHVPTVRLPEHMAAFAITVHKSQGSEWDEVALLLPNRPSRLLSRELLYTAISRARSLLTLYGSEPVLHAAIGRRADRATGLVAIGETRLLAETTVETTAETTTPG